MNDINDLGLQVISPTEYMVTKECAVKWDSGEILVPKGFITNLASVPKFFQNILPPNGKYGCASVAHDYLYATYGLEWEYTIDEADLIFKRIMEYDGVKPWKIAVMYNAVKYYNKDYPE